MLGIYMELIEILRDINEQDDPVEGFICDRLQEVIDDIYALLDEPDRVWLREREEV